MWMRVGKENEKRTQRNIEIQINNEKGDEESTEEENNHKNMKRFDNNQSLSQRLETLKHSRHSNNLAVCYNRKCLLFTCPKWRVRWRLALNLFTMSNNVKWQKGNRCIIKYTYLTRMTTNISEIVISSTVSGWIRCLCAYNSFRLHTEAPHMQQPTW